MEKLRNRIWTGYNGGSSPEDRKIFKKFLEIGHVKLKI